jgi:hypothetical protein
LQTGEYDYAWNVQVEDEVLKRLEAVGKGTVVITPGGSIEHIQLNSTDPWIEMDGERSSIKTSHPTLGDPVVRAALSLLVDRDSVRKYIYGRTGIATANYINNPDQFRSNSVTYEFNIEKAIAILQQAGWRKGEDGIRVKDGRQLKYVFQTSGMREGRHRHRDQGGDSVCLFLVGRSQSGHLSALLRGPADVQYRSDPTGPGRLDAIFPVNRGSQQGEQVAGPQCYPLAECGIRRAPPRCGDSTRPSRARSAVHQDERPGREPTRRDPLSLPSGCSCSKPETAGDAEWMGQHFFGAAGLVYNGVDLLSKNRIGNPLAGER